jgi:hypothetical protein
LIETGIWTGYNDWSICSVTCGEGYQFRKRECLSSKDITQKIPSDNCIGTDIEIRPCNITTCPGRFFSILPIEYFSMFLFPIFKSMAHGHHGHHVQNFVVLV